jgi:hypothetical protein
MFSDLWLRHCLSRICKASALQNINTCLVYLFHAAMKMRYRNYSKTIDRKLETVVVVSYPFPTPALYKERCRSPVQNLI